MGRYVGIEWPAGWEDCGRLRGGIECPRCANLLVHATPKDGSFGSIVGCDNCLIMSQPGSRDLVVISSWVERGSELVPYEAALNGTIVGDETESEPVKAPVPLRELETVATGLVALARELMGTGLIEYVNGLPQLRTATLNATTAAELRLVSDLLRLGYEHGDLRDASRVAEEVVPGAVIDRRRTPDRRSGHARRRGDQPRTHSRRRSDAPAQPALAGGR